MFIKKLCFQRCIPLDPTKENSCICTCCGPTILKKKPPFVLIAHYLYVRLNLCKFMRRKRCPVIAKKWILPNSNTKPKKMKPISTPPPKKKPFVNVKYMRHNCPPTKKLTPHQTVGKCGKRHPKWSGNSSQRCRLWGHTFCLLSFGFWAELGNQICPEGGIGWIDIAGLWIWIETVNACVDAKSSINEGNQTWPTSLKKKHEIQQLPFHRTKYTRT